MKNRGALRTYQLTPFGKDPRDCSWPFTLCDTHKKAYRVPVGYRLVKLSDTSQHPCMECRKESEYE